MVNHRVVWLTIAIVHFVAINYSARFYAILPVTMLYVMGRARRILLPRVVVHPRTRIVPTTVPFDLYFRVRLICFPHRDIP